MTSRADAFADSILATMPLFTRFLSGFDEASRTLQAPQVPNHAIWTLGHLAVTMHRVAAYFDHGPMPETDFTTGDGGAGDTQRFDTESVCIGSQPSADASIYPTLERGRIIFEQACERFINILRLVDLL